MAVVTLAAPHIRSPAHLQRSLAAAYRRVAAAPLPAAPLLSVAGGAADVLVPRRLTRSRGRAAGMLVTEVDTERLTGVWAAADHQVGPLCAPTQIHERVSAFADAEANWP